MASIIKKITKGRPYNYAVESQRVGGKPRIVWQKYFGTIEAMVERAEQTKPPKPKEMVVFEAGGVAALWRIAQRLGLLELLDETLPKREQGPSVGHYLLLAALNRALDRTNKVLGSHLMVFFFRILLAPSCRLSYNKSVKPVLELSSVGRTTSRVQKAPQRILRPPTRLLSTRGFSFGGRSLPSTLWGVS